MLSQEEACFWLVRPGGGRDGPEMAFEDRGTFQSSWAREELATVPGDHADLESPLLAVFSPPEKGPPRLGETQDYSW